LPLLARLEFGIGNEVLPERELSLGKLILVRRHFDPQVVDSSIRDNNLSNLLGAICSPFDTINWSGHLPRSSWPDWAPTRYPSFCFSKSTTIDDSRNTPFTQSEINDLYNHEIPHGKCPESFATVLDAIKFWIPVGKGVVFSAGNFPIRIQVIFPLDPGQISNVTETDDGLLVAISGGIEESEFRMVLAYTDRDDYIWKEAPIHEGKCLFPETPPGEFLLKLLRKDEMIHWLKTTRGQIDTTKSTSPESIEKMIRLWEREDCELKEFGRDNVGDQYIMKHILKVVVAFANAKGGDFILGVSDETQVIGFGPEESKAWASHLSRLTSKGISIKEALVHQIRQKVSEHIEGIPDITYVWVDFRGMELLHIHVDASRNKGITMTMGKIFIRKGGKSLPASREDVHRVVRDSHSSW